MNCACKGNYRITHEPHQTNQTDLQLWWTYSGKDELRTYSWDCGIPHSTTQRAHLNDSAAALDNFASRSCLVDLAKPHPLPELHLVADLCKYVERSCNTLLTDINTYMYIHMYVHTPHTAPKHPMCAHTDHTDPPPPHTHIIIHSTSFC